VTIDPPDLIETASRTENWTDNDHAHCERMLRDAYEDTFQVTLLQQAGQGLIAYDAPFSRLESVKFQPNVPKPVLQAIEDLSRQLLRVKGERET
jgi:hypothetical protein